MSSNDNPANVSAPPPAPTSAPSTSAGIQPDPIQPQPQHSHRIQHLCQSVNTSGDTGFTFTPHQFTPYGSYQTPYYFPQPTFSPAATPRPTLPFGPTSPYQLNTWSPYASRIPFTPPPPTPLVTVTPTSGEPRADAPQPGPDGLLAPRQLGLSPVSKAMGQQTLQELQAQLNAFATTIVNLQETLERDNPPMRPPVVSAPRRCAGSPLEASPGWRIPRQGQTGSRQ